MAKPSLISIGKNTLPLVKWQEVWIQEGQRIKKSNGEGEVKMAQE